MPFQSVTEIFLKLDNPNIKLSALGVTFRAFFDWKDKKAIDSEHNYSVESVKK